MSEPLLSEEALQDLERQVQRMTSRQEKAKELLKTHQHHGIYFAIAGLKSSSEFVQIKVGYLRKVDFNPALLSLQPL